MLHRHGTRLSSALFTALSLAVVISGCGSESPTRNDDPAAPPAISVIPAAGPPGTVFAIDGLDLSPAMVAETELRLAGLPGGLLESPTGQLLGAVPLKAAGEDGRTPPAVPQDVELWRNGTLIGRATAAFLVEGLHEAPGASRELAMALSTVGQELSLVAGILAPEPGVEQQWLGSIASALVELIDGDQPGTLASALTTLETDDPATLELLDRYFSGSGILESTRSFLAGLQAITEKSDRITLTSDVVLARKMQFYVLAKLFGETVVHETAEEYAYTVGLATGLIGIGADVPAAAVVSAVLAVADFAVNKVLLGLLPASVTSFTLTLEDPDLLMGKSTDARVDLTAANAPPGVGIQDFVGLTLNLLGLGAGAQVETFTDVLLGTASFFLATTQQLLSTYSDAHPELGLDVSVQLVPALAWETTIHDPRLVDRKTLTPTVITGLADEVNWRAATNEVGDGHIFAMTAIGPDALLLDVLPGFIYSGGAFGEDVHATQTLEVHVTGALILDLEFDSTIDPGQSKPLTVRAGYAAEGTPPLWSAGLHVEVVAEGGTVSADTGATDGSGTFVTMASLGEGSEEILLSVTVSDDAFHSVTQSVTASTSPTTTITFVRTVLTGFAGAFAEAYPPNDNGVADRAEISEQLDDIGNVFGAGAATATDVTDGGGVAEGQADVSASSTASLAGHVLNIHASYSGSSKAYYSLPDDGYFGQASAGQRVFLEHVFLVEGGGVDVTIDVIAGGDAGGVSVVVLRYGGSFVTNVEGGGSWSGELVLPGFYTLTLERQPLGARASSGLDGGLNRTVNQSMSGGLTCTVTAN